MDSGRCLSLLAVASSRPCFVYLAPSISYAPATQGTQATHQAEAYLGFHRPQRRLEPLGHRSSHPVFIIIIIIIIILFYFFNSTHNIFLFFSLLKHHCRNCGGIFCNSCSDYTMPLPSSAKPVRVCDACYTALLQRYQR